MGRNTNACFPTHVFQVLESTLPSCYDKNLFQEASVTNMTSEVPEVQMDLSQFLETDVRTENQERADTLSVDAKTEELQDDIRLPESDSENAEEEAEQAGPLSPTGDELSLLVFGATWEERRTEMAQVPFLLRVELKIRCFLVRVGLLRICQGKRH